MAPIPRLEEWDGHDSASPVFSMRIGLISASLSISIVLLLLNCVCGKKQENDNRAGAEGKKADDAAQSGNEEKNGDASRLKSDLKSTDPSKKVNPKSGKVKMGEPEPMVAGKVGKNGMETAASPKAAKKGGPKGKAEPKAPAVKAVKEPTAKAVVGKVADAEKKAAAPKSTTTPKVSAPPKPFLIAKTVIAPPRPSKPRPEKSTPGEKPKPVEKSKPIEKSKKPAVTEKRKPVVIEEKAKSVTPVPSPKSIKSMKTADDTEMRASRSVAVYPTVKPTFRKNVESARFD